ncbi:MAG TPA: hypothetical protein VKP67_18105 [Xanthobacteraceae bacterium]|nr:hypothetical protein [Xanthobacteraceae bacterium]
MDWWFWPVVAGLGAFHGLNPAMGWLFAVALGLHRKSRAVVFLSLLPIAAGHAVSIAFFAVLLAVGGYLAGQGVLQLGSGLLLLGWAGYHWRMRHRHRVRFGLQTGLWGLAIWSFLMATSHGAGLMLWPALMPACLSGEGSAGGLSSGAMAMLAGVGLHTLAMIATTAIIAALVYEWLGVALLRRAWLNIDLIWLAALAATGALLLIT